MVIASVTSPTVLAKDSKKDGVSSCKTAGSCESSGVLTSLLPAELVESPYSDADAGELTSFFGISC